MTATGDGQDPQLHYDIFANALKAKDANMIVSATPECQYGSLGSNPLASAVTTANIDFFLCASLLRDGTRTEPRLMSTSFPQYSIL
jgi:hypothetical protein